MMRIETVKDVYSKISTHMPSRMTHLPSTFELRRWKCECEFRSKNGTTNKTAMIQASKSWRGPEDHRLCLKEQNP